MSFAFLDRVRTALTFRLALWYAGVFALSTIGLFALTYHLLARSLEQRDRELVEDTLREYAAHYDAGGLDALRRVLQSRQRTGADADRFIRVVVRDRDSVLLSLPDGWAELATPPFDPTIQAGILHWSKLPGRRAKYGVLDVATFRFADGTLFQVGRAADERLEILARFRRILVGMLAVVLFVALTGGVLFTHSALRPLRDLTAVVSGIVQTGRLSQRVPVKGSGDALDDLAVLVNSLLERIQSLVSAMRDSIDNVAHDLRTPLTRLHVVLDEALRTPDVEQAHDGIADALEETERVAGTLDVLMDVSEAEAGVLRLELEEVPLADALEDAVELYEDLAQEKSIALTWESARELRVRADRRRLRQVLANLVDNAVKYTPAGGRVHVDARREGDEGVVTVADTGPGIGPADRERIWERLYRADPSRSERGLGLGLNLVRAIVQAHGGTVTVETAPGEGARFIVRLPMALTEPHAPEPATASPNG
jgi:signal transduction histidine kinase